MGVREPPTMEVTPALRPAPGSPAPPLRHPVDRSSLSSGARETTAVARRPRACVTSSSPRQRSPAAG